MQSIEPKIQRKASFSIKYRGLWCQKLFKKPESKPVSILYFRYEKHVSADWFLQIDFDIQIGIYIRFGYLLDVQ